MIKSHVLRARHNAFPSIASFPLAGADVLVVSLWLTARVGGAEWLAYARTTRAGLPARAVCNQCGVCRNSLKVVPTAQNCLLISGGVVGCDLSEKPLKNLVKAADFQAEYEGLIPFTRFNLWP
jgi:hypothetical protein